VLKRLTAIPIDTFLLALAATVALAALLPAHGAAAEAVSIAAKVAIALLFFLYGTRLSPQQAWHGVRQWRLHLLVLATTFVIFPILGNRSERNRSRPSMRFLLSWDWVRTEVASSGYDFGGPTSTVMIFPILGMACRALVPSVLTIDLYQGVLFLCLVPSTVQSSIAFTSIARGHVSAAVVSAS